jgi:D-arabinono-1,4-lactone oxidase/FAD binding domain
MAIRDLLGSELFEKIRLVVQKSFPDPRQQVSDELVGAVVQELQRRKLPGIEQLGLPPVDPAPEVAAADSPYPLYLATAKHHRTLAMNSAAPFESEFIGYLPTVRVPLPQSLNTFNTTLSTAIGEVEFASDHLAGSVELLSRLYSSAVGYAPARVDLITPARRLGVRFGAVAVYLAYRNAADTQPSFYVLEAGLATGQPAMLFLGATMESVIVQPSGYVPTPFAAANNTYTGNFLVVNDQPKQLVIRSNAPNLPQYIEVAVSYSLVTSANELPVCLTVEAIERVSAIGKQMGVNIGFPPMVESVLGEIGLLFLPWVEKPATTRAPAEAATTPPGVTVATGIADELKALLSKTPPRDALPRVQQLLSGSSIHTETPDLDGLPNGAAVAAALSGLAVASGADGSTTGNGPRQTWANQLANQQAQPLQIFRPTTLCAASDPQSVQAALLAALASGSSARAIGSGHSYSDVATTPDFLIDTHGLNRLSNPSSPITGQLSQAMLRAGTLPLALAEQTWPSYAPETNHALIEMEAGITIRALNPQLDTRNVGLMNMGGYDGQTIIGAISTSTHGSGARLPPFPDMVRSLVLATTGSWTGKTFSGSNPGNGLMFYRIEPSAGITDPAKYSDPLIQLIQDDGCFQATICSMGCFGVIYSVVLEVMQQYWLTETRSITTLDVLMKQLQPNPANPRHLPDVLLNTRNYEVLIQPYPISGFSLVTMDPKLPASNYDQYFSCLVTQRNIAPQPATPPKPRPVTADWLGRLLDIALHVEPSFTPAAIDISLLTLINSGYVNRSYDIYNLALAGDVGFAAEIGFSLQDANGNYTPQHFRDAVDQIHRIAQRARLQGEQYQTSAFSLRFVDASQASLSMMQGQPTAMIEMDMLTGTYAGDEIMFRYQTAMHALGGRPHWGLEFDTLNGSDGELATRYPQLAAWLAVYAQFNQLGTFNNRFTERMGFSTTEG